MNFSSPIKYSNFFSFSPNNKFFLFIKSLEIHVYETKSLTFLRKFSFNDAISSVEWSQDSNLILVGFTKMGVCEVKSLDNPDWMCKIDEGVAGMASCRWSPDSRRVITICEFNLRMTIWSLIDRSTTFINYPKYCDKGISFTSNNCFMGLIERKESKDYLGIYYIADWTLVSHFAVDTVDAQNVLFTKDDGELVIWDSVLENKFFVYSPTGNLISSFQAYDIGLGIKNCMFSPNGNYLATGYFDQQVRLFSQMTWKHIDSFNHPSVILDPSVVSLLFSIFSRKKSKKQLLIQVRQSD